MRKTFKNFLYFSYKTRNRKLKRYLFDFYTIHYNRKEMKGKEVFFWGVKKRYIGDFGVDTEKEIKQYEKSLSKYEYDDAYFFGCGIGEIFYFLHYVKYICNINGSKKPLFVSQRKFFPSLIHMFIPDAIVVSYWCPLYWVADVNKPFHGKKHRFFFPFSEPYFINIETSHAAGRHVDFFDNIISTHKINVKNFSLPEISNTTKEKVNNMITKKKLENNFVILCVGASSNGSMSDYFWEQLKTNLKKQGIKYLVNSDELNLEEIRYLATKCKAVIGVRSGLLDVVADVAPKAIVFYKPFAKRLHFSPLSSATILRNFTLKKIPFITNPNNIVEYDTGKFGEEEILSLVNDEIINLS